MKKYLFSSLFLALMAVLSFSLVSCDDDDDDNDDDNSGLSGGSGGYTGTLDGVTYSFTMNDIPFKAVTWISTTPALWIFSYYESFNYTIWGYIGEEEAGLNILINSLGSDSKTLDLYNGKDITDITYISMNYGYNEADYVSSPPLGGNIKVVKFTSENLTIEFNNYALSVDKNSKSTVDSIVLDGEISMDYITYY